MTRVPIAIIDPSMLFREGFESLLRRTRFKVVVSAATIPDALAGLQAFQPEVVVFVIEGCRTVEQGRQLTDTLGALGAFRVVLLSDIFTRRVLDAAASAGVRAVLSISISTDVLQRSLTLVLLGQQMFPAWQPAQPLPTGGAPPVGNGHDATPSPEPGRTRKAASLVPEGDGITFRAPRVENRPPLLADHDLQIIRCLVAGLANKDIARETAMNEATVKRHIKGLLRKIGLANRTQIAIWGLTNLVTPPAREPGPAENGSEPRERAGLDGIERDWPIWPAIRLPGPGRLRHRHSPSHAAHVPTAVPHPGQGTTRPSAVSAPVKQRIAKLSELGVAWCLAANVAELEQATRPPAHSASQLDAPSGPTVCEPAILSPRDFRLERCRRLWRRASPGRGPLLTGCAAGRGARPGTAIPGPRTGWLGAVDGERTARRQCGACTRHRVRWAGWLFSLGLSAQDKTVFDD